MIGLLLIQQNLEHLTSFEHFVGHYRMKALHSNKSSQHIYPVKILITISFFHVLGVDNLREQAELNQELVSNLNLNEFVQFYL